MNDTSAPLAEESVWSRLRRRKLVQWTVAYVAGAWGLLQGVAYMRDTFGWPAYVQQAATVLLLIGLPIVLVLAWYHGDRGQRQVTRSELAILTLLFLLGGALYWYFQRSNQEAVPQTATPAEQTTAAFATDASIAVLPFINMSSDKEQEYFADGISEELLNLLAKIPELRVIARTSSFSFKGKDIAIADIARALNVANVLEGSVRRSGDKLRITAQLIRASDSSHLWSQTYDRQLTDVFLIQDEIAAAVVAELKVRLLSAAPRSKEADPGAYALFLQAREIGQTGATSAVERSIEMYEQALAIDPEYAAAWVGLASSYIAQAFNGFRPVDEGVRLAREAANRALAIDAEYAPAHAALGWLAMSYDRDPASAARLIQRALTLDPSNLDIVGSAAWLARRLNRLDLAIALANARVKRDPANAEAHELLGHSYRAAGRSQEAIGALRAALALNSQLISVHGVIGEILLQQGDAAAALVETQQEAFEDARLIGLATIYYALNRRAEADAALATLIREHEQKLPFNIAYVYAFRGDAERAFAWLDKALQYRDAYLSAVATHPMFASLHSDPRWLPFLRKLGMAPEQLAAIQFDVQVPK